MTPTAFISHTSADKSQVKPLAEALMAHGVDVFLDEWEIRPGDSIVRKVNAGLGSCTDFLVILSVRSLLSEWVQTEMDAGFILRLEKKVRFIPVRLGLTPAALPSLLRPMNSPSLDDLDQCVSELVSVMHGLTEKPPLGPAPPAARQPVGMSGFSPAADSIARLLAQASESGLENDPLIGPEEISAETGLSDEDIGEAVHELAAAGLVHRHQSLGMGEVGFHALGTLPGLFRVYDPILGIGEPEVDARAVANHILAGGPDAGSTAACADSFGWTPRRMNPAISVLIALDLVLASRELDPTWLSGFMHAKPGLRAFARS